MRKLYIIVPIFNVEKYVSECIDSILAQDIQDMSIILINDKSTDTSLEIARRYATKHKNIILLENDVNLGLGATRNVGIKYVLDDTKDTNQKVAVGFVDSDDVISKDYYVNLLNVMETTKSILVKSADIYTFDDLEYKKSIFDYTSTNKRYYLKDLSSNLSYATQVWRALYDVEILKVLQNPALRHSEDVPFGICANALSMSKKGFVAFSKDARYFYRKRIGSITKKAKKAKVAISATPDTSIVAYDFVYNFFKQHNLLETYPIPPHLIIPHDYKTDEDPNYLKHLQEYIKIWNPSPKTMLLNPALKHALESKDIDEYTNKVILKKQRFQKWCKKYRDKLKNLFSNK